MAERKTEPVRPGLYRHFKGGTYEVLFTAEHSETGESLVIYRFALPGVPNEGGRRYARPEKSFRESVRVGSGSVKTPRFLYLGLSGTADPVGQEAAP